MSDDNEKPNWRSDRRQRVKIEDHLAKFQDRAIWTINGPIAREVRRVMIARVLKEVETRGFELYCYRGRYFLSRPGDDSIFYEYGGTDELPD